MIKFYIYGIVAMIAFICVVGFFEGDCYRASIICLAVFTLCMYMAAVEAERHDYRLRREHEKALRKKEDSSHRPKRTESSTQEIA